MEARLLGRGWWNGGRATTESGIGVRPGLRLLVAGSFGSNVAIWGALFVGSQTLSSNGASPLAVQLMAVATAVPLLVGGSASARFRPGPSRRLIVLFAITAILSGAMLGVGLGLRLGGPTWLVYVGAVASGVGQLAKMTLYRPELYERAGDKIAPRALALDALYFSAAVLAGPLLMGFVLSWDGAWLGYVFLAIAHLSSCAVILWIGRRRPRPRDSPDHTAFPGERQGTLQWPGRWSALVAVLGVTVIFNFCYLPLQGLVPLIGMQFSQEPWRIGVLASATGLGMLVGNGFIAALRRPLLGQLFTMGPLVAFLSVVVVSRAPQFWMVFGSLVLAGLGGSAFAATQATLVLRSTPREGHARSMGLVSVAVSVMPAGALAVGAVCEVLGTRTGFQLAGMLGVGLWILWLPACWPMVGRRWRTAGPSRGQAETLSEASTGEPGKRGEYLDSPNVRLHRGG